MVTAEELVVAVRDEGIGETRSNLEGVEQQMEETADSAGESAEQLEGFSERFAGAMSAAVAALAVGAAGLLSQVPVLGEAFGGLAAIVQALAFQMDGVLRPVLTPLTNLFYAIADAIFNADGALGGLIGVITTIVSLAAVLIPAAAAIGAQLGVWASTAAGVIAILGKIVAVIGSVVAAIASLPAAVVVAIAAILAIATALIFNIGGARDKLASIIGDIWNFFTDLGGKLVSWASDVAGDAWDWGRGIIQGILNGLESLADTVVEGFVNLASGLAEWASGLADSAFEWGKSVIRGFIRGIKELLSEAGGWLDEVGGAVGIDIPDAGGAPELGRAAGAAVGGGAGAALGGLAGSLFSRDGGGGAQIDGRALSESTGRYRSDPARRRGL